MAHTPVVCTYRMFRLTNIQKPIFQLAAILQYISRCICKRTYGNHSVTLFATHKRALYALAKIEVETINAPRATKGVEQLN